VAFERQDREWASWQEVLDGSAIVRQLMLDLRHNADLIVAPADALDPGCLTQSRSPSIGGDEQARVDAPAVRKMDPNERLAARETNCLRGPQALDVGLGIRSLLQRRRQRLVRHN